jgi:secreted trypsin-like serine protease
VIPNTSCKTHGLTLSPNQLCAGGEKGKGSCQGDSGGGLFMRKGEHGADGDMESPWYLLGIISYGQPACGMGIPDVYTRVSKYVDWIRIKIRQ